MLISSFKNCFQYVLFEVTSLGFVDDTFDAIVEGITQVQQFPHAKQKKLKYF